MGRESPNASLPINIGFLFRHHALIFRGDIEQEPQREIRAECALMLIQVQGSGQEKGHVVLHGHVDHIVQSDDLQRPGIAVVRVVQRVVQLQQGFPVPLEDVAEEPVLYIAIGDKPP